MSKWRDKYRVHPKAAAGKLLPEDKLRELGEDIKAHGLRELPAVTRKHPRDADGHISVERYEEKLVDGQNRMDAMELVGIEVIKDGKWNTQALGGHPIVVEPEDVEAYVISRNIHRRHLSKQEVADQLAAIMLADDDEPVQDEPVNKGGRTKGGKAKTSGDKARFFKAAESEGISPGTAKRSYDKAKKKKVVDALRQKTEDRGCTPAEAAAAAAKVEEITGKKPRKPAKKKPEAQAETPPQARATWSGRHFCAGKTTKDIAEELFFGLGVDQSIEVADELLALCRKQAKGH
jgi:hypothetical protein